MPGSQRLPPGIDRSNSSFHAQTFCNPMETQFTRQIAYNCSLNLSFLNPWSKLWPISSTTNDMCLFTNNNCYLTHLDFEPRNLLAYVIDEHTVNLSPITDGNEAVFALALMNCCPPSWLWDFEGGKPLHESKADDTPADPGLQAVKDADKRRSTRPT